MIAVVAGAAIASGAIGNEAAAWGTNSRRTIVLTALQLLRRTHPDAFRTDNANYEKDLLAGVQAGVGAIGAESAGGSLERAVAYIAGDMALLREVRKHGAGSYFSYRMGVLASVVSDLVMPFTFDFSPEAQKLKGQIDGDIETRLAKFAFRPRERTLGNLRDPELYFAKKREFLPEVEKMIRADYSSGTGYEGYLRKGGEAFFGEAVRAVADAWHTVFLIQPDTTEVRPSREAMTWYYVREIEYLLMEKENSYEAKKVYARFAAVNPGIMKAYESVGDYFYHYGDKERGVQEWRLALEVSGPERQRLVKKLSGHYLDRGKALLAAAAGPEAPDRALENAMTAFTLALQIDITSEEAARLLSETSVQLSEKEQRLNVAMSLIAQGDLVMTQAAQIEKDPNAASNAMALLKQAQVCYDGVSGEFPAQAEIAKTKKQEAARRLDALFNGVFKQAETAITEATDLQGDNRFDDAVQKLDTVAGIVQIVPDEDYGERKNEIVQRAASMKEEVSLAKARYEDEQRRAQELAAQRAASGGVPPR